MVVVTAKPSYPAPLPPNQLTPLESTLRATEALIKEPDYDKGKYKNHRDAILYLLRDDNPDNPATLENILKHAKRADDIELIDAVVESYSKNKDKTKHLSELVFKTYTKIKNATNFEPYSNKKYYEKLKRDLEIYKKDVITRLNKGELKDKELVAVLKSARHSHDGEIIHLVNEYYLKNLKQHEVIPEIILSTYIKVKNAKWFQDYQKLGIYSLLEKDLEKYRKTLLSEFEKLSDSKDKTTRKKIIDILRDDIPDDPAITKQILEYASSNNDYELIDAVIASFIKDPNKNKDLAKDIFYVFQQIRKEDGFKPYAQLDHYQKLQTEFNNYRNDILARLQNDSAEKIPENELGKILSNAIKLKDAEIADAALQYGFKYFLNKFKNEFHKIKVLDWFIHYTRLPHYADLNNESKSASNTSNDNNDDAPQSKRKAKAPRPSAPAPTPDKNIPLTVLFSQLKVLLATPDYDKSVYNNYRKALLSLLKDDIPDSEEDLGQLFKLAKETNDVELIDAIISPFVYTPIKGGKLFDQLIETLADLKDVSWFRSFFSSSPYQRKLEQVMALAFATGSVSLNNQQLRKLLQIACDQHDYKLALNLLSAPPREENDDDSDDDQDERTKIAFEILESKIKEYYAAYSRDKKCLFWLVAIKDILNCDGLLNFRCIDIKQIKDLAELSLAHNNIQFVEAWIKIRPDLLDQEMHQSFISLAATKYKQALMSLLENEHARNGFGMDSILDILSSPLLGQNALDELFPNTKKLIDILDATDPSYRNKLQEKLINKSPKLKEKFANTKYSDGKLETICLNGEFDKLDTAILGKDVGKIRIKGKSLLHYVVKYNYNPANGGWPDSVLKKPINEQQADEAFQTISKGKNLILEELLRTKQFSNQDIQDAYNKAYRDGNVERKNYNPFSKKAETDKTIKTDIAGRGDHALMKQLEDAGANPAMGESFIGVWRAVTYSYAASAGIDFVLGTTTGLIQHYLKVPAKDWYNRVASYVSGGTSAAAFLATGAVKDAYYRNLNPDYYNNNFLDLTGVNLAGNYKRNWYGGIQSGKDLGKAMASNAGVIGAENAITDADSITSANKNVHHKVALDIYDDYLRAEAEKNTSRWYFHTKGLEGFMEHLEAINLKCDFGIPGDNGYSFNTEFQKELQNIFSDANVAKTIESIVSFKQNEIFFMGLARGIEQGLIKTPLSLKKQILNAKDNVIIELAKSRQGPVNQDVPYVFGRLRKIYDNHSKEYVPLSVLLVAQFYKQLEISSGARKIGVREKIWICFRDGWQNLLGKVAPKFGMTKEQANDVVATFANVTLATAVGFGGYYEKKLRDELATQGIMKSTFYISEICRSAMSILSHTGIPPLVIIPVVGSILVMLYSRHKEVDLITATSDLAHKIWDAMTPHPDSTGIFINHSTLVKFNDLLKFKRELIPEVVGMSL